MSIVRVPDVALAYALDRVYAANPTALFQMDLFQNNVVIDQDTTFAMFAVATFPGYLPWQFSPSAVPAANVSGHVASSALPPGAFLPSADDGQLIYGWYLTDQPGNLVCCGNFDAPVTVQNGVSINVGPTVTNAPA